MDKKEWLKHFEIKNGRKPTSAEYIEAKNYDFKIEGLNEKAIIDDGFDNIITGVEKLDSVSPDKRWLAEFERIYNRKPSPEDFLSARKSNYSLDNIYDLNSEKEEKKQEEYQRSGEQSGSSKEPLSPKSKMLIFSTVILVFLLGGSYLFANDYFSESKSLQRYVNSYNNDGKLNNKKLDEYVWSDNKETISESQLKYLPDLPKKISPDNLIPGTFLIKDGKKLLFFPNYKIDVLPQTMTIMTNTKGLDIKINNKELEKSDSESYAVQLDHLFPGKYNVSASGTINGQKINVEDKKELYLNSSEIGEFNLDLKYLSFKVESNIKDGDLYIANEKIGNLKDGKFEVSKRPVITDGDVYVKKKMNDGDIESNKVKITDIYSGETVQLDSPSILSLDSAEKLMVNAYSIIDSYGGSRKISNDIDKYFQGGVSNPFFVDSKAMIDTNTVNAKNRSAEYVNFSDVNVTNIVHTGKDTYNVDFEVTIRFYYSSSTDKKGNSSGYVTDRIAWSAKVKHEDISDSSTEYKIVDKNGESKNLNSQSTVR